MRKLNLSLDALVVESFDPSPLDEALRGTVRGNTGAISDCGTCVACDTVEDTCQRCLTINFTLCFDNQPCIGQETGVSPTCNNYTCFGETCPPMKGCIPTE